MSSIVVSRSGDFCVIVQQLLRRADDRPRESSAVQYAKNLGKDSGIRDMRAVPRQQVVYLLMSHHGDMQGVDTRRSWQNRLSQDLFGNAQDCPLNRQDRDTCERLESTVGQGGITIRRLVEHVLRGNELVVCPLCTPLPLRQQLPRRSNDLTTWSPTKVADD
jgi:hypothetical protein